MTKQQTLNNDDLVERYVAAVARQLPPAQADDIAAELREAVTARLETMAAERGEAMSRASVVDVIKGFGSPMLVAARYAGRQYLIGPQLYPYFWPVARLVVGIVAVVAIVGSVIGGVLGERPVQDVLQGLSAAWHGALVAFGAVTAVFVLLEQTRAGARIEEHWRPEHLPRDTSARPRSLFESLFSLAVDAVFIAWWLELVRFPNVLPGTAGEQGFALTVDAATWAAIQLPVLVVALINAGMHAADVLYPTWSRARGIAALAAIGVGLYVTWLLATASGQLLAVVGPAELAARLANLNAHFAVVSTVAVYGIAIGLGFALVVELRRLRR